MKWLLSDDARGELEAAYRLQPTAEQIAAFEARATAAISRTTGTIKEIDISGVLTETPNIWASLSGGNTTYRDIRSALAQADADPSVREIVLNVSSPGGAVDGLFLTLDAINATTKPMRVRASLAASAAYALAAAAGPIEALGPASAFGSIGVAASIFVDRSVVHVTSTAAPNKRVDATTDEGKAVIREELDEIHELFASAIATGRGVDVAKVNKDFGRGSTYLAKKAKERKMIDSIGTSAGAHGATASAQLGPNRAAAAALAAQLGGATAPAATESSSDFARRLLAGVQPPAKPTKSIADQVCEIVLYGRALEQPKPDEREDPKGAAVADAVIAGLRAQGKDL